MVPVTRALNGLPGSARRVRTEITPPRASEPYATDPGPRAMSMPSTTDGSRNVPLGPTRRSAVTRPPSIRNSVRPRASPRTAGTAACPSETWLMPGHGLERLHEVLGIAPRDLRARQHGRGGPGRRIDAGRRTEHGHRLVGERSELESTSSLPGQRRRRQARATCPPASTTITWNGTGGAGAQVKRPSLSVRAEPLIPTMDTDAPATGAAGAVRARGGLRIDWTSELPPSARTAQPPAHSRAVVNASEKTPSVRQARQTCVSAHRRAFTSHSMASCTRSRTTSVISHNCRAPDNMRVAVTRTSGSDGAFDRGSTPSRSRRTRRSTEPPP